MLLVGNGYLISRDPLQPFIENGCVGIDGKLIVEVGDTPTLRRKYPHADFIDAHLGLILPGLINTHHHSYSTFARGANFGGPAPKNFMDLLTSMWWKLDNALTLEDVKYSAYSTYMDCIKNGVTTVFDHHASYGATVGSLFTLANVAKELGLRTSLCYEVSDRHGEEAMKLAVSENSDFIKATLHNESQKGMMGLHASFTLSDQTLDYCQKMLPSGAGYHIHVAEGMEDVYDSLHNHGTWVVNRLLERQILGDKTIAAHCIHITPQEMDLLKQTDTIVVHNPESNMGNAVGAPQVLELCHKDILVGLGTDGYTSDLFESMKVANLLQKHHTCDPAAAWREIPTMLFENNAAIVGRFFETPVGVLKAGAAADVIVADYFPPTPLNSSNVDSHILFGLNGCRVQTTIAGGRVLMKGRKLLGIDE